jgi:hypothetical protein
MPKIVIVSQISEIKDDRASEVVGFWWFVVIDSGDSASGAVYFARRLCRFVRLGD